MGDPKQRWRDSTHLKIEIPMGKKAVLLVMPGAEPLSRKTVCGRSQLLRDGVEDGVICMDNSIGRGAMPCGKNGS
jgi:hypothetical protein